MRNKPNSNFRLSSSYQPQGDQPQAIDKLSQGLKQGLENQVLLGVTGSGKTFTIANVIAKTQVPTLVIAHNKTLAAQLYQELREFFPKNAVCYFVSYYDYYQPEAYLPTTDTYIEKEAMINEEIDKLRLATTTNLLTRPDVVVVASVSCIYNLGSPIEYGRYLLTLTEGEKITRHKLLSRLTQLQYERSTTELQRGTYRLKGDILQIWPAYEDHALMIDTLEDKVVSIDWVDPISGQKIKNRFKPQQFIVYPAKHYLMNPQEQEENLSEIEKDLEKRLKILKSQGQDLIAYRLEQKVRYDLEMMREFGFVNGIENYSRYFDGRQAGQPPFTLLDYFNHNVKQFGQEKFLTVIDESHMTLPQIKGMHRGDQARKQTLIDYGFRLPSALDNRPLTYQEFANLLDSVIYVSATPEKAELELAQHRVVEQLIRPTGLVDPAIEVRPTKNQVQDLVKEIMVRKQRQERTLVTTLTKKMAEALTDYLNDKSKINPDGLQLKYPKVAYLHSDIKTLERSEILADLRRGDYDVVVGINLLREGLDLPEVSLVAILDADQTGFLRSRTSLIQTMGRAARHQQGKVILYADKLTPALKEAMSETKRRRRIQLGYNRRHNIKPSSIVKPIRQDIVVNTGSKSAVQKVGRGQSTANTIIRLDKKQTLDLKSFNPNSLTPSDKKVFERKLTKRMKQVADNMDFELAAMIRDTIKKLKS